MLRHSGHAVRVTRDGRDTIAACRVERPDVVLLDFGLPKLNGHDIAVRLREEFGAATPRLIALTGCGQSADRRRSAELGIEADLIRPVDMSELNALLANGNGRSHGGSPTQRRRPTGSDLFARSLRQRLVAENRWHVMQVSAALE